MVGRENGFKKFDVHKKIFGHSVETNIYFQLQSKTITQILYLILHPFWIIIDLLYVTFQQNIEKNEDIETDVYILVAL